MGLKVFTRCATTAHFVTSLDEIVIGRSETTFANLVQSSIYRPTIHP